MDLMEQEIKSKLQSAFDVTNIYGIFESLITAVKDQQVEIKALQARFDKLGNIKESLSSLEEKFHILEFNVQGFSSHDQSPLIIWDQNGEHVHPNIATEYDDNGSIGDDTPSSFSSKKSGMLRLPLSSMDLDDPFSFDASRLRRASSRDSNYERGDKGSGSFILKRNPSDNDIQVLIEPNEKLVQNAKKEVEHEEDVLIQEVKKTSPREVEVIIKKPTILTKANNKANWRAKRHRILLALQIKGQAIRRARIAQLAGRNNTRQNSMLNPQRTINHRIRTLEARVKTLTTRLDTANKFVETIHSDINARVPADLREQLDSLRNFIENVGHAVLKSMPDSPRDEVNDELTVDSEDGAVNLLSSPTMEDNPYPADDAIQQSYSRRLSLQQELIIKVIREQLDDWSKNNNFVAATIATEKESVACGSSANSRSNSISVKGSGNRTARPGSNNSRTSRRSISNAPSAAPLGESVGGGSSVAKSLSNDTLNSVNTINTGAAPVTKEFIDKRDEIFSAELQRLRDMINDIQQSQITFNQILTLLSPDSRTKDAKSFKALLHSFVSSEVEVMIEHKIDRDEFAHIMAAYREEMHPELQRIEAMLKQQFDQFEAESSARALKTETKFRNLTKMLREVESTVRIGSPSELLPQPAVRDDWRGELMKFSEIITRTEEHQKQVAQKLLDDIETIQEDIGSRPSEAQVSQMMHQVEDALKRQLGETSEDMSVTVSKIVNAIRNKANKEEVTRIISERIAHLEASKKSVDEVEDISPAGAVKCISCGAPRSQSPPKSTMEEMHAHLIAEMPHNKVDYDQMIAVLNRKAGLKPLSRRFHPMQPKVHPYLKKQNGPPEQPLYRKAQLAAALKEVTKLPNLMSMSTSSPSAMYYLDDANSSITTTNHNNPNGGSGIRLPGVNNLVSSKSNISNTVTSQDSEDFQNIRSNQKGTVKPATTKPISQFIKA